MFKIEKGHIFVINGVAEYDLLARHALKQGWTVALPYYPMIDVVVALDDYLFTITNVSKEGLDAAKEIDDILERYGMSLEGAREEGKLFESITNINFGSLKLDI